LVQLLNGLYNGIAPTITNQLAVVTGAVDNAIVAAGNTMMEWVKREQALREAISSRGERS